MKQDVISIENKKVGTIDLDETVFGLDARPDILARKVRAGRATVTARRRSFVAAALHSARYRAATNIVCRRKCASWR